MEGHSRSDGKDDLDPTITLGFILSLPLSRVKQVRDLLATLTDVRVVVSKLGVPRTLWIVEGDSPREGRS